MDDPELEVEGNDQLRQFLGTESFGKQTREANVQKQVDLSKRTDADASGEGAQNGKADRHQDDSDDEDDHDDDDDDDDDDDEDDEYPTSHEMVMKTHERAVTAVTLDPSGARLVSGGMDCTLKFHDFASMTPTTIRAFKSVDPTATKSSANVETHPVHQALFNPLSAGHILVATALPQAKILSRDGDVLTEFVKGDMYLRDMHNTKGHISEITTGTWHPTDRNLCVTAGTDSTLRIWDINHSRSQKEVIVHKSKAAGSAGRSRMTAVAWGSPMQGGSNVLVSAALDGSLVMWSGDGPFSRPAAEVRDAHAANTWTGGLDISADGRLVVTRGGDDTIKVWDTRKFKQPINTVSHASTSAQYPTSSIRFSPNSSSVITGSETGHLHILNPATLKPELVPAVTPGSPLITAEWHPKLNQIVTGSANSEVHVLYNPNTSVNGAKTVMSRAPKRRHIDDDPNFTMDLTHGLSNDSVIVPGGPTPSSTSYASRHPTVGLTASGKSRDPRRPQVPAQTPFAKGNPDQDYVRNQIPLSSLRDEDPREALLKYADKAKNDPLFTNAWKDAQPEAVYAELSDEEEGGPEKKKAKR
ncbi:WD repeat protein [Hortaea werneckii]|nr:WD repeat protein [Hortaea werneckii]KAI7567542.1 WD repeat protein [Hortaea werneckii]KAI7662632.1 WD repeat protein [Hortaea werneckii]KAI7692208.1 WD repeat protein [Hortaea werneckii]